MRLWSDRWVNGEPIPARFAPGQPVAGVATAFSDKLNPHPAWREVPADLARVDFCHGLPVALPATLTQIDEVVFSRSFIFHRKPDLAVEVAGARPARQGLNHDSGGLAGNVDIAGDCFGHASPCPPFNDSRFQHPVFTVFARRIARTPVEGRFSGAQVRDAICPHIRAEAMHSGTDTMNRRLR